MNNLLKSVVKTKKKNLQTQWPYSNYLILCGPLLLLPSISPSISIFSNESALCLRWPKYWRFNVNPSNEYSRLISFRIDWFDLLAVQRVRHNLATEQQYTCETFTTIKIIFSSRSSMFSCPLIIPSPIPRLMLKLKLQYFNHLMRRTDSLEKTDAGKDWRQEEKGMTGWDGWMASLI